MNYYFYCPHCGRQEVTDQPPPSFNRISRHGSHEDVYQAACPRCGKSAGCMEVVHNDTAEKVHQRSIIHLYATLHYQVLDDYDAH